MQSTNHMFRVFSSLVLVLAAVAPAYASGSRTGGGGTGGGGTGGGGTGGGGATTGAIRATSASVTCDDGTGLVVSLRKGASNQVEMTIAVASAVANPPSGMLEVLLADQASGTAIQNFGSWPFAFVAGLGLTNLGSTIAPGAYTLDFTAIVHDGQTWAGASLVGCTASIPVIAD
jgi:hypothetical protein